MEDKIDKILLENFKEGDWINARNELSVLFNLPVTEIIDAGKDGMFKCCTVCGNVINKYDKR